MPDSYLYQNGLSGDHCEFPDIDAYDYTTSFRVDARVALDDYSPADEQAFWGSWDGGANEELFRLMVDGDLELRASGSLAARSTTGVTVTDGAISWFRVDFTVGAGDGVVSFYESTTDTNDPDLVSYTLISTHTGLTLAANAPSPNKVRLWSQADGGSADICVGGVYRLRYTADGVIAFDADMTQLTVADLEAGSFTEDSVNAATVLLKGIAPEWAYVRPFGPGILGSAELLFMADDGNKGFSPRWADRSGNNHHAELGSAAASDANDPLFKAYDGKQYIFLPGIAGNYLSTPDYTNLNVTTTHRVEARLALDDWTRAADEQNVASQYGAGSTDWIFRVTKTGLLDYFLGAGSVATSSGAVSFADGAIGWVAVEATLGSGDGIVTFYTSTTVTNDPDAVSWTQLDQDTGLTITDGSFDEVLAIGAHQAGTGDPTHGDIYRVRIICDGVTQFDLDLTTATEPYATMTESSSNAATVTINRSSSGLVSTVVDRDQWLLATDDYFDVDDHVALDVTASDSFTLMILARTTDPSTGSRQWLVGKSNTSTDLGYRLYHDTGTNVVARFHDTTPTSVADTIANPADLTLTTYAMVRDVSNDDLELFFNGVGSGSATTDGTTNTIANAVSFRIGASSGTAADFIEGSIMAIVWWRSALTDAEVGAASALLREDAYPSGLMLSSVGL